MKNFITTTAFLLLVSLFSFGQGTFGSDGNLEPAGPFAVVKIGDIQGSLHIANDTSDLADYLKTNAIVYQLSDDSYYRFTAGTWVAAGGGASGNFIASDGNTTLTNDVTVSGDAQSFQFFLDNASFFGVDNTSDVDINSDFSTIVRSAGSTELTSESEILIDLSGASGTDITMSTSPAGTAPINIDAAGAVDIEGDGIDITTTDGPMSLNTSGAGGISISTGGNAGMDFTNSSSGGMTFTNSGGAATIFNVNNDFGWFLTNASGSGPINITNANSNPLAINDTGSGINISSSGAGVTVASTGGPVNISNSSSPINLTSTGGAGINLSETVDGGGVSLSATAGGNGVTINGIRYPDADGTANQVLTTNGSNVATWEDAAGGGGSVGGINDLDVSDGSGGFQTTSLEVVGTVIQNPAGNVQIESVRVNGNGIENVTNINAAISDLQVSGNLNVSGNVDTDILIDSEGDLIIDSNGGANQIFLGQSTTAGTGRRFTAQGTETDINLFYNSKGAGRHFFNEDLIGQTYDLGSSGAPWANAYFETLTLGETDFGFTDVTITAASNVTTTDISLIPKGLGVVKTTSAHTSNIANDDDLITKGYADANYSGGGGGSVGALNGIDVADGAGGFNASNLSFDGSTLLSSGNLSLQGNTVSISSTANTFVSVLDNLLPNSSGLTLGSLASPWGQANISSLEIRDFGVDEVILDADGDLNIETWAFNGNTLVGRSGSISIGAPTNGDLVLDITDGQTFRIQSSNDDEFTLTNTAITAAVPVRGTDGSNSAPGFSFSSASNKGIYAPNANAMGFAVNGQPVMTLTEASNEEIISIGGGTSGGSVRFGYNGATNQPVISRTGDTDTGLFFGGTDDVSITTGGSIAAAFTNSEITVSETIAPSADGTLSLGTASNNFDQLHIDEIVMANGTFTSDVGGRINANVVSLEAGTTTAGNADMSLRDASMNDLTARQFIARGTKGATRTYSAGIYANASTTNGSAFVAMDAEDGARNYYWPDNSNLLRTSTSGTDRGTTGGTVVGDQTSDIRLKNVKEFQYGLEEVLKITPISYTYTFDEEKKERLGFSAQQVMSIMPEPVYDSGEDVDGSDSTKLVMNYKEMIPVLFKAIQEQNQMIIDLTNRIEQLEK